MKKKAFFLIILIVLIISPTIFPDQDKGVKNDITPFYPGCKIGKQYLVLIAIDKYQHWKPLQNPVKDAKEIKEILTTRYHVDRVIELHDEKATKKTIMKLFRDFQNTIHLDDSLLIFYSGHGHLDDASDNSFWIPADGGKDEDVKDRWINNSEIRGIISNMSTKHILIISDSCFSGDLLEINKGGDTEINNEYLKKAYSRRCRQALTSGARERVPYDSVFSNQLKHALKENISPYLDTLMIYNDIRLGMKKTLPLYGEIKQTNHQKGASFLFFLKTSSGQPGNEGEIKLGDLEEIAKWQNIIKNDIDKFKKFEEKPGTSPELKIEAWNRLLEYYSHINAWRYDEKQEDFVKRKIEYWKKIDSRNKKKADDEAFESTKKVHSIENYEKYISEYPVGQHLTKAYYNCGAIYYEKEEYDKAVSSFAKAIERDPKFVNAYIYRGLSYDKAKNYENAISDYSKAIELDPKKTLAYKNLGLTYDHMREYAKAIYNYTKVIEINPQDENAFYYRGVSYDDSGKYDLAIKDLTKAIKLDSNDEYNYNYRGVSYEHSGKYEKAISDYKEAIKIDPDYIMAYNNMARVYEKLGKKKEAEEARGTAKKLKNKDKK